MGGKKSQAERLHRFCVEFARHCRRQVQLEMPHMKVEAYQLWYEYLRRSERYKEFCLWAQENKVDSLDLYFHPANGGTNPGCYPDPKKLPGIEQYIEQDGSFSPIVTCFLYYGDIFNKLNFARWFYKQLANNQGILAGAAIQAERAGNPDKEYTFGPEMPGPSRMLNFCVHPAAPDDLVLRQLRAALKEHREAEDPQTRDSRVRFFKPSTRVRVPELRLYLQVYDLKAEGKTMVEIVEHTGTKEQKRHPANRETGLFFWRYLSKAKKIIGNVERGYFPGSY